MVRRPTPLVIRLSRSDPRPLGIQLADQVRATIQSGALPVGTRLPSSRSLATELKVSRAVTEQAWQQLLAEGWVTARAGSGTFVEAGPLAGTRQPMPRSQTTSSRVAPRKSQQVRKTELVSLGAGVPWIDPKHRHLWRRAWREVAYAEPPRGYGDPRGLVELREVLADRLRRIRGLDLHRDDIRITSGTVAGLRHLLDVLPPGPIAMEDPGYRAAATMIGQSGRSLRNLPAQEPTAQVGRVVARYLTPAHQHPLGFVLSAEQRIALIERAQATGELLIEDDYDSEFRYDIAPIPALAALAPDQVAYLGSASKTVAPSVRLGWMVAPDRFRDSLDRLRDHTHDSPPWASQQALLTLLRDGYVDAVVRSAKQVYAERAPRVAAALSPFAELAGPSAGMYSTWLMSQPRAVQARRAAAKAGFELRLLSDYTRDAPHRGIVVGFGGVSDSELDRALAAISAGLSH